MIKQSDIEGRLNLFRYGVIVVIVIAFVVSLAAPMVLTSGLVNSELGIDASLGIGDLLMPAIIITVITALIGIVAYFAYAQVLQRTAGSNDTAAS